MVAAQAFGVDLILHDEADLAGLCPPSGRTAPTEVRHDPHAVRDRWAGAVSRRTRDMRGDGVMLTVDHDPKRGYLINAPGAGSALISADGLDVRYAPEVGLAEWRPLLLAQVLPLVATIRGLEVFHAAGVVCDGRANLLCGPQGVGKSSLAAHLVMAGAELLADDVVAVDDSLYAHSGVGVLNLRPSEAQIIADVPAPGLAPAGMLGDRMRYEAEKPAQAQPVGAIYLLSRGERGPSIERVDSPSALDLLSATFNLSVQTPLRMVHQLDLCTQLVARIPVYKVRIVPASSAAELAAALYEHITAVPAQAV